MAAAVLVVVGDLLIIMAAACGEAIFRGGEDSVGRGECNSYLSKSRTDTTPRGPSASCKFVVAVFLAPRSGLQLLGLVACSRLPRMKQCNAERLEERRPGRWLVQVQHMAKPWHGIHTVWAQNFRYGCVCSGAHDILT